MLRVIMRQCNCHQAMHTALKLALARLLAWYCTVSLRAAFGSPHRSSCPIVDTHMHCQDHAHHTHCKMVVLTLVMHTIGPYSFAVPYQLLETYKSCKGSKKELHRTFGHPMWFLYCDPGASYTVPFRAAVCTWLQSWAAWLALNGCQDLLALP